jgi:hypothetical protein
VSTELSWVRVARVRLMFGEHRYGQEQNPAVAARVLLEDKERELLAERAEDDEQLEKAMAWLDDELAHEEPLADAARALPAAAIRGHVRLPLTRAVVMLAR